MSSLCCQSGNSSSTFWILTKESKRMTILVAARSKARFRGRSLTETAGSNTAESMDVCLLWVLCVVRYRSLRRADPSSRDVLPNVCTRVCVLSRNPNNEAALARVGRLCRRIEQGGQFYVTYVVHILIFLVLTNKFALQNTDIKYISWQVPSSTCFETGVPSSGSLLQ
jgi:hypothetical protein